MKFRFFYAINVCIIALALTSCFKTTSNVTSNVQLDTVAYLSEKNRVYWEINNDKSDLIDKDIDFIMLNTDWFKAWGDADKAKREQYIKETIELYKNKKGE